MTRTNLFLPSPADRHLSYFHLKAIINKAPRSILLQMFLWMYASISFLLSKCLEVRFLDPRVGVYLVKYETARFFPKWLYRFTVPPTVNDYSKSLHICQHMALSILAILVGV
jgi:hypothetical protein